MRKAFTLRQPHNPLNIEITMSAVTALILVGSPHPNDGGNRDFAQVTLEEGDRPALIVRWTQQKRAREELFRTYTMIPTLENLLDDSVLLIAYVVCRVPTISEMVNKFGNGKARQSGRMHMHEDFEEGVRLSLYAAAKQIEDFPKVTWCLFKGSALEPSMGHLVQYKFECEVTRSVYRRSHSGFTGEAIEEGLPSLSSRKSRQAEMMFNPQSSEKNIP
jgi:hypothetical protein